MAPEEFAKFYPPLLDWIQTTLTASAGVAETVATRGFWRLPLYFTEETLTSAKVVLVDPLPMPPLSSMGLAHFAEFERGIFEGITYIDMDDTGRISETLTHPASRLQYIRTSNYLKSKHDFVPTCAAFQTRRVRVCASWY